MPVTFDRSALRTILQDAIQRRQRIPEVVQRMDPEAAAALVRSPQVASLIARAAAIEPQGWCFFCGAGAQAAEAAPEAGGPTISDAEIDTLAAQLAAAATVS